MPEIVVQGNNVNIADGDATPSTSDDTDFGTPLVGGSNIVRTFTIQNTGPGSLNLSGSPIVAISGSSDFSISTQPAGTTVAGSGSTTFQVTLDPTTAGMQTANISIDNNDTDENPYNFSIRSNNASNADGSLTAAAGVSEPVNLPTTATSAGAAVDVFDFTLSDGGGGDGQPMAVSQIVVNVSGTSTDTQRGQLTWRLNGPDAGNVMGTYNAAADTVTFGSLSISVPDGGNEVYTVDAFYNNNSSISDNASFILSVDGDTDVTTTAGGTSMGTTTAVTNGAGGALEVTATGLAFTTQPAGSVSGSALTTQPVVTARDAYGNTDTDFTETVTLTEASAGGVSNNIAIATSGVATFSGLTYTATADQQGFTLTADDQAGVGTDLSTVNSNAVTSDVVATRLIFATQPVPLTVSSGIATSFTTVPVVRAVDASGTVDTNYSNPVNISEVNGAGTVILTSTGDVDANGAAVTQNMSAGEATFVGSSITYTLVGVTAENFNLRAASGSLTSVNSSQLTASSPAPVITEGSSVVVNMDEDGNPTAFALTLNATDANNDTLTWSIHTQAAKGSASVSGTGTSKAINYVPTVNKNGSDSFVVRVSDGSLTDDITVNVVIAAVNDAPTISGTPAISVNEDAAYSFTPTANDVDNDSLTFSITNKPAWANFNTTNGALTGTPNNDHVGTTSGIVITVSDGTLSTSLTAFNLAVNAVNGAPTISGTPATSVNEDTAYSFTPTANDVDNDSLTFSITNKPVWTNFNTTSGALTGIPNNDHVGTTSDIVITVSDGTLSTSLPAFNLTVNAVNDAPNISGTPAITVNEDQAYSFTPTAADAEGSDLTFSITNKPDWADFNSETGALTGTPDNDNIGTTSGIVIGVSDGLLSASLPAFNLEVVNQNDAATDRKSTRLNSSH